MDNTNTMQLTQTQQTALDFYSDMADQVSYFGLTILADREERQLFKQGRILSDEITAYAKRLARNSKRNPDLTPEHASELVTGYLSEHTPEDIVSRFQHNHPEYGNADGLLCQLRIIAGCDTLNPQDSGLDHPGKALVIAMENSDSDRFQF